MASVERETMSAQETLAVGKRCVVDYCAIIDFLPFQCQNCRKTYCADHVSSKEHTCKNKLVDNRTIKCLVCSSPIAIPNGEDPNIKVDLHIRNNCKKINSINVKQCQFCHTKTSITTFCKECHLELCLAHRHIMDHQCKPKPLPMKKSFSYPKLKKCPVQ